MKQYNYFLKFGQLFQLIFILTFVSCSSYKQAADYPNLNSLHRKKFDYQAHGNNKEANQKSVAKVAPTNNPAPVSSPDSIKITGNAGTVSYQKISLHSSLQRILLKPVYPNSNNEGTLIASLSKKLFISRRTYGSDNSTISTITAVDSSITKVSQSPVQVEDNKKNKNETKQNNRDVFAIISLASAALSVGLLILLFATGVGGALFLLFLIPAVVFGALGLKSSRRKMALSGMLIGIFLIALFVLFALAYAGVIF